MNFSGSGKKRKRVFRISSQVFRYPTHHYTRRYKRKNNSESVDFSTQHAKNLKALKRFYNGRNGDTTDNFFVGDSVRIHKNSLYVNTRFPKKNTSPWSEKIYKLQKINPRTNMFMVDDHWQYKFNLKLVIP